MLLPPKIKIWFIPLLLVSVTLACAMPGASQPTASVLQKTGEIVVQRDEVFVEPTLPPPPTPTPQPLPPALVEVDPPPRSVFPLQGPLTLYFNQPMDQPSVEIALTGQPALSGRFNWVNDSTVIFEPDNPFLPDTDLNIKISTSALATNGQFLQEAINLTYRTISPLKALQVVPEPGLRDVDPSSAVVVAFNQPVLSVGADPASTPRALTIDPVAPGHGEWVNTSTYIFYPDPALEGGHDYTVRLNPDLHSTAGGPFVGREIFEIDPYEWVFSTSMPHLVSINPGDGAEVVHLDSTFRLEFNQAMDAASVGSNFAIYDPNQQVIPGEFGWNDSFTTLIFTPTQLLSRNTSYTITLLGTSQSRGGTPLKIDHVSRVTTVPDLGIASTEPMKGGSINPYASVILHFNGPAQVDNPFDYVTLSPEVPNLTHWWDDTGRLLYINGTFDPISAYTATISSAFPDPWGGILGDSYIFNFSTTPLESNLFIATGGTTLSLTPSDSAITAQATNIEKISMHLGAVPFGDLIAFLSPGGYQLIQNYLPENQQNWTYDLGLPGDKSYIIQLPITRDGKGLAPGIYHLRFFIPELLHQLPPYVVVSSNIYLSFKMSTTGAFVWAVDSRTNQPAPGASVSIYDSNGSRLASGVTDAQGVFQSPIPTQPDLYSTYYAVLSEPGDEFFSLSLSTWGQGIEGHDFGFNTDFTAPDLSAYIYTDRPIYRPGQTVFFRTVLRHEHNGRYALPGVNIIPITIYDGDDIQVLRRYLPVSEYGTTHGEYRIPEDAQPSYYTITVHNDSLPFQVALYHKPEIDLNVGAQDTAVTGSTVSTLVNARYFFDAPADNIPLTWRIFRSPLYFHIPGYRTGVDSFRWMDPSGPMSASLFGELVSSGSSSTSLDGTLMIDFPTDPAVDSAYMYTIEATLTDESGIPVSARTEVAVHPSDFYIGVRPDTWVGKAGTEIAFEIKTVDWDVKPAGGRTLSAQFQRVTWQMDDSPDLYGYPTFTPQFTPVSSADFFTAPDGIARLAFIPPEAGTYQLEVSGGGAHTQILVWVGGAGAFIWPDLPNNRLQITASQDHYEPGDIANFFIPNPFGDGAQALITVERDEVLRHDVLELDGSGYNYSLALTDQDAPNVYVSVTLIGLDTGGKPDFRQGYLNLAVDPVSQKLMVAVIPEPLEGEDRFEPRDEVTFKIIVTDSEGNPVQGEFSLSVVDRSVLALADPNAADILSAFYGNQPLGVRTGMSLVVYAHRRMNISGGLGGGGEDEGYILRQDFPDTAYWNAEIITDADGEAEITLSLPDSLTTWEINTRGLTRDTRVGQNSTQVITTKDLLVRPVAPRFLVVGDHTALSAVIHNNTANNLQVDVSLQGTGFTLDDPNSATQSHAIAAGDRLRVEWWGLVEDVANLDLVFSATGGGYQDAVRPNAGNLPVLKFTAPQTFATAGVLDLEGERLEIISLPRTFDPTGGTLRIKLAPSLAAAMTSGFEILEQYPYQNTEQTISRFLPNLMAYRAIQDLGLDASDLRARLERTLDTGIQELASQQNDDGGWGWWLGDPRAKLSNAQGSDTYITAYVVFGLNQARQAGAFTDDAVIQEGINYLLGALPSLEALSSIWQLDQLAFYYFTLAQTGSGNPETARNFFEVRDQLSPYAKAFLALTLATYDPEDERINTLLSDLDGTAIRTATGIHWEGSGVKANLDTPMLNTAVTVYVIAKQEPAAFILPEAVRYLMAHRDAEGSWGSTYETAWTLMALTEVMKGTGELAGDFGFTAALNGKQLLSGQAGGDTRLTPVGATVPVNDLYSSDPNGLSIQRTSGPGRLYYAAHLSVLRPVVDAAPLNSGIGITRTYDPVMRDSLSGIGTGDLVTVKVSVTLENDAHYLVVEDHIPAGAEILDTRLKTSQRGIENVEASDLYKDGWGWWYFSDPQIYDDHIIWTADRLPAGTYELRYTLVLTHPGEYQVLPARAWEFYFSEVQGNSAGEVLVIEEK